MDGRKIPETGTIRTSLGIIRSGLARREVLGVLMRLHHFERGGGEGFAHQCEGFRAAEVVVTGIGCAAIP